MPAISAKHFKPIVFQFSTRLSENGSRKQEVIGTAMHKLLHITYGILKSNQPFNTLSSINIKIALKTL